MLQRKTNNSKKLFPVFLSVLFLSACVSEKIEPDTTYGGTEYFPFLVTDTAKYKVVDIKYTIAKSDTNTYFLREQIIDVIEKEGNKTAIVAQCISKTLEEPFATTKLYSIALTNNELIYKIDEKNYLYSPLPLEKGAFFDYNLYNSDTPKMAYIDQLAADISVSNFLGDLEFKNAMQIVFEKRTNAIEDIYKHVIYASNKGLVYALDQSINQQPNQLPIGHKTITIRL